MRRLALRGAPRMTAAGLGRLAGAAGLEEVELHCTPVTNEGLGRLADLPALRALTVSDDHRHDRLDDRGLPHLARLTGLRRLRLSGGWASAAGVAELRPSLPGCEITTD